LQAIIDATYGARDRARGVDQTFRWLVEEVGELARALRDGQGARIEAEISDVLAWTVTIASLCGVDAERAASRYAGGCPKCHNRPCTCAAASA
jgi:NTP pyrophosphatase (non-canonical NTP hydrolase)